MSWGFEFTGTQTAVKAAVAVECDKVAANYAGKEEGKDVLAVKDRLLSLIGAMAFDEYSNSVLVKASGSHSSTSDGILGASFTVSIQRVALKL